MNEIPNRWRGTRESCARASSAKRQPHTIIEMQMLPIAHTKIHKQMLLYRPKISQSHNHQYNTYVVIIFLFRSAPVYRSLCSYIRINSKRLAFAVDPIARWHHEWRRNFFSFKLFRGGSIKRQISKVICCIIGERCNFRCQYWFGRIEQTEFFGNIHRFQRFLWTSKTVQSKEKRHN